MFLAQRRFRNWRNRPIAEPITKGIETIGGSRSRTNAYSANIRTATVGITMKTDRRLPSNETKTTNEQTITMQAKMTQVRTLPMFFSADEL